MNLRKIGIIGLAALTFGMTACKEKGCTDSEASNFSEAAEKDDNTCVYPQEITLDFTQNFAGSALTVADFNDIKYTNENGEELSLTKLQYSISDIRFYKADGDSVLVDMHHLVDLEDATTLSLVLGTKLDPADYTGVGFNFGFTPTDNISGEYADLNLLSWGWPDMIGGGYHQMKMEGKYINSINETKSYQFHNGSATKNMTSGEIVANYFYVNLANSSFTVENGKTIEIKMDIAEWYKSPNTWDLNTLYTMLMPNHDAQLLMTENGPSVFSVGTIK